MIDTPNYMPSGLKQIAKSLMAGRKNGKKTISRHFKYIEKYQYFANCIFKIANNKFVKYF